MKPDPKYIKNLLDAFELATGPHTDVAALNELGWDVKAPSFLFHMRLLHDEGLLESADPRQPHLGFRLAHGHFLGWADRPLRLTAAGHAFAASLGNKAIFDKAKTTLATSGMAVTMEVVKLMALQFAKDQLGLQVGE